MIFSELEYKRIDLDALKEELKALTAQLASAKSFEEAETLTPKLHKTRYFV